MSTLTERERAERAAYAETRDGAIPRLDRMAWGDEDARPVTGAEARLLLLVMAVALTVFGLLCFAIWLWANGKTLWR